jgi:hypothetical protein
MSKLQEAYNSLIAHFPNLVTLAPLINSKNKFSEDEKLKILAIIQEHVDLATDVEEDIERRLGFTLTESQADADVIPMVVDDSHVVPATVDDSMVKPATVSQVGAGLTITEYGKAFHGVPTDTVAVPVLYEPILYESKNGRWSWRTKVYVDPDFRHINVGNFYAKGYDSQGTWYALVDKAWKTEQPLFKDYCNQAKAEVADNDVVPF